MSLKKVLVANRGEIAARVLRACRESGIATVAVCSEADRDSPYTRVADEVRDLGGAKVTESYLNLDRILEVASATGCDAIHPGYGFFAENAKLVRRIEETGLTFIGPSSASIALMGDKLAARRVAADARVPLLPGTDAVESPDDARRLADKLGYPVILKPAAGGGGIGMTILRDPAGLERAYTAAARLGQAMFGSGAVLLLGGEVPSGAGAFYPPTLLTAVDRGMPAFDEETFGPVAAVIRAKDEADGVRLANDSAFAA